ncbi:MAG: biotin/lipoyl-containing protein [Syntrophomonadaceae bacterium]|jgi:acetyl-CoA carboxylase biotin carboxyl carrier protein
MEEIIAAMPGKIVEIPVQVGDKVTEDTEIMIVESMKMESPIYAGADGVVKEIKVKVGDAINEGDVLMVLE